MKAKVGESLRIYNKNVAQKNKKNILLFFQGSPFSTNRECSDSLGLSLGTISKHKVAMRNEFLKKEAESGKCRKI